MCDACFRFVRKSEQSIQKLAHLYHQPFAWNRLPSNGGRAHDSTVVRAGGWVGPHMIR